MKEPAKKKNREKEDKRRQRVWGMSMNAVEGWVKRKFAFDHDDFDAADIDGPIIVAVNHASAYDPIFTAVAFRNKRLSFIASEHILRMPRWGALIDRYISIIPHRKGAGGSRTALVAMKRIKRGESIFLAVEGEQTWDGKSMPVMPYTGKLVKFSGATLVNYRLEGAYLSAPRWSFSTRKCRVCGRAAGVYGPEILKDMSDEEVEDLIARDLDFDTWEWQKSRSGGPLRFKCAKGGNADGLERSVFACPECGAIGKLRSSGDHIGCDCGFKVRLADTGFFGSPAPFETVCDWEASDRKTLEAAIEDIKNRVKKSPDKPGPDRASEHSLELFGDDGVTLLRIEDGHSDEAAARGRLSIACDNEEFVLEIGGHSFSLKGISNMTMVLAARIVFSDKSGYYELRSAKGSRTNLRKYVIARGIISEMEKRKNLTEKAKG